LVQVVSPESESTFVFDSLVATFDEILPLLPDGACRVGRGYRLHFCPAVPFDLFCGVWLTDPGLDGSLAEALPGLIAEVEAQGLPSSVFLASESYPQTRRVARSIGLAEQGRQEAMVLTDGASGDAQPAIPGLSITEAADPDSLRVALGAAAAGFEAPEGVFAPLYEPSLVSHPGVAVYTASVAVSPVSTGVGYLVGSAVGVYNVATPPQHRRRGYAGEIVRRIVTDGFRNGATTAYLLASPDGVGVYRRIGFHRVGGYDILARPSPVTAE
jgi:N-acetylglutamate synthase